MSPRAARSPALPSAPRFRAALLGSAVGGLLGATGETTDAAAPALAVAEGLIEAGPRDAEDLDAAVAAVCARLGGGPPDFGAGSLLWTLPIALAIPGERELAAASARIAALSRYDPLAESACAVWCRFVRELLGGVERRAAWRWAVERTRRPAGDTGGVVDALEAAADHVLASESFEATLAEIVDRDDHAGDLAALAGGALGIVHGAGAIPARWLEALRDRARLERAAAGLAELRHRATYECGGFAPMLPGRSLDGVYSGRNPLTDLDVEAIAALGCRIVVDLRQPREWEGNDRAGREALAALAAYGLERLHLPTPDGEAPADRDLAAALVVVEPAGRRGAGAPPVYVHCRAGQERTAAVLLAAHARRRGLSTRAALAELQRADPRLHPLPWQVAAVERFLHEAKTPSTAV